MSINTSNVAPKRYRNGVTDGIHDIHFVESKVGHSNTTENVSVSLEFSIQGRKVFQSWWCTADALPYMLGDLAVIFGEDKVPVFEADNFEELAEVIVLELSRKLPRTIKAQIGHTEKGFLEVVRFVENS